MWVRGYVSLGMEASLAFATESPGSMWLTNGGEAEVGSGYIEPAGNSLRRQSSLQRHSPRTSRFGAENRSDRRCGDPQVRMSCGLNGLTSR